MATPFNLTARLNIEARNIKPVVDNLRAQLKGVKANVAITMDKKLNANVQNLNKTLAETEARLKSIEASAASAAKSLKTLNTSMSKSAASTQRASKSAAQTNTVMAKTARGAAEAAAEVEQFGKVSGLAIRRFAGFTLATGVIFGFINAVKTGISEAIKFEREIIRLAQVSQTSVQGMGALSREIRDLSTSLGVSSSELVIAARTLKQAGFTAAETKKAMSALAKTDLAPTFNNIAQTTEGAIAALRQFNLSTGQLESTLGSINAVAARFAVESEDIISAIRRTGGVFAAASGSPTDRKRAEQNLREFIALFTSVRATTRESGESIATGLRTIFTRITRRSTIDALGELGVKLKDAEGKFVGPIKAISALNAELGKLNPSDLRFFQISEQIAGFRQIGKVIPLIREFATTQDALKVAYEGQNSLAKDAELAQQSLAVQITKTREKFLKLLDGISKSDTFQILAKTTLVFADSLIALADSLKGVLPALAIFAGVKAVGALGNFLRGFRRGITSSGGAKGLGERVGGGTDGSPQQQNTTATKKNTKALGDATKGERNATKALQTAIRANTSELVKLQAVMKSLIVRMAASGRVGLGMGGKAYRKKYAVGGPIPGRGDRDGTPVMAQGGEFMVNRKGVQKAGLGNLIGLNTGGGFKPKLASRANSGFGDMGRRKQYLKQKLDYLNEQLASGNITDEEIAALNALAARVKYIGTDRNQRFSRRMFFGAMGGRLQKFATAGQLKKIIGGEASMSDFKSVLGPSFGGRIPDGLKSSQIRRDDPNTGKLFSEIEQLAKVQAQQEAAEKKIQVEALPKFPKSGGVGVAGIFAQGKGDTRAIKDTTKVKSVIGALRSQGLIGAGVKEVFMPVHRAFLDDERGEKVRGGIQRLLKQSVVDTAAILGRDVDVDDALIESLMRGEGFNLQDAGGKLFEAGLKAGLGLEAINSTIDFPNPTQVGALRSLYPDIPSSVEAADAKLTANADAYNEVRREYANLLGARKNKELDEKGGFTKEALEKRRKARQAAMGGLMRFALGGMANVALMPGEDVYSPDQVSKIGLTGLRKANQTGDRSGLSQSPAFKVPGSGNTDSFYTQLPVGSFVIRKKFSEGFAKGGAVGMAAGDSLRGNSAGVQRQLNLLVSAIKNLTDQGITNFAQKLGVTADALTQFINDVKQADIGRASGRRVPGSFQGDESKGVEGAVLGEAKNRAREVEARKTAEAQEVGFQAQRDDKAAAGETVAATLAGVIGAKQDQAQAAAEQGQRKSISSPTQKDLAGVRGKLAKGSGRDVREFQNLVKSMKKTGKSAAELQVAMVALNKAQNRGNTTVKEREAAVNKAVKDFRAAGGPSDPRKNRPLPNAKDRQGIEEQAARGRVRAKRSPGDPAALKAQVENARLLKNLAPNIKKLGEQYKAAGISAKATSRAQRAYEKAVRQGSGSTVALQAAQKSLALSLKRETKVRRGTKRLLQAAGGVAGAAVAGPGGAVLGAQLGGKAAGTKGGKKLARQLRGLAPGNLAKGLGRSAKQFGKFFENPATASLLFAAPGLADSLIGDKFGATGKGVSAGIAGGLSGAFTGAQVAGPAGAVVGAALGATTSFISGRQEARRTEAETNISDSASSLDKAFNELTENFNDTSAIKAFNSALHESVNAAAQLQTVFAQEEETFGSIGATIGNAFNISGSVFGTASDDRGAIGAEVGAFKLLSLEFQKTFGGISKDIDSLTGIKGSSNFIAGPLITQLDKAGVFGTPQEARQEEQKILDKRNTRRNQELFQALQPASKAAQAQVTETLQSSFKARGTSIASASNLDLDKIVDEQFKKFSANSKEAVQALAALDPKKFEKIEPQLNRARESWDEASKEYGDDSEEAKKAQEKYFAVLEGEGKKAFVAAAKREAGAARFNAQLALQVRRLDETAEAIARVGDNAARIAENLDMGFQSIGDIMTLGQGGFLGGDATRNPFENISQSSTQEIEKGLQSLEKAAGGRLGGAAARFRSDIGQSKLVQDNLTQVIKDALEDPANQGKGQEQIALDAIRNDPRLKGLNDRTRSELASEIGNLFDNRQGAGLNSIEDALKNTEDISKSLVKRYETSEKAAAEAYRVTQQANTKLAEGFAKIGETIVKANEKFDQAFKLRGQRGLDLIKLQGGVPTVAQRSKQQDDFVKRLTGRAGIGGRGGTTNVNVIGRSITGLTKQIQSDKKLRQSIGSTNSTLTATLTKKITENTLRLKDANQALNYVATSTEKLSAIQDRLAQLQQKRELGRNLLDKLSAAKFDPQARIEINNAIRDALQFGAGLSSGQNAGGLNLIRELIQFLEPAQRNLANRNVARQQFGGLGNLPPFLRRFLVGSGALSLQGRTPEEQKLLQQYQQAGGDQINAINIQGNVAQQQRGQIKATLDNILQQTTIANQQNLRGQNEGGFISGAYKGNRDTEVRKLVPGEFVVRRNVAQKYSRELQQMNAGMPVAEVFAARGGLITPRDHMLNFRKRNARVQGAIKGQQRRARLGKSGGALDLAAQGVIASGGRLYGAKAVGLARDQLAGEYLDRKNAKAQAYAASRGVGSREFKLSIAKGMRTGNWRDAKAFMRYLPASPEFRVLKNYINGQVSGRNMTAIRDEAWEVALKSGWVNEHRVPVIDRRTNKQKIDRFGNPITTSVPHPRFATGGLVAGVVPGEFVVNKNVTGKNLDFLQNLNASGMPGFRYGGYTGYGPYSGVRRPPRAPQARSWEDQLPPHLRKYSKPYSQRTKDIKSGKTRGITSGFQVRKVELSEAKVRYSSSQDFRRDADVQARAEEIYEQDRSIGHFGSALEEAKNEKRDKLIAQGQMQGNAADKQRADSLQRGKDRAKALSEKLKVYAQRSAELKRMEKLGREARPFLSMSDGGNPVLADALNQIKDNMNAGPGDIDALRVREKLIKEGIAKYRAITNSAEQVRQLVDETGVNVPFDLRYMTDQQVSGIVARKGVNPIAAAKGGNIYLNKNKQKDFNSYIFRHEYGHLLQDALKLTDDRNVNRILEKAMASDAVQQNPNIAQYQKVSPREMFANLMATSNNSSIGKYRIMLLKEIEDITSGKRVAGNYAVRNRNIQKRLAETTLNPSQFALDIIDKAKETLQKRNYGYSGSTKDTIAAIFASEDPMARKFAEQLRMSDPRNFASYQTGISRVGNTGMAMLHKNEAVVPANAAPGSEAFTDLARNMGQLNTAVKTFMSTLSGGGEGGMGGFAQFANQLAQASSNLQKVNIPSTIEVTVAPMQVNVVVNGAEALASMQEPIRNLVTKEISRALNNQINPITGETNETFTQV